MPTKTAKPPRSTLYRPGMRAPASGQYRNSVTRREVTVKKGDKLPPTRHRGARYRLVDSSRHR